MTTVVIRPRRVRVVCWIAAGALVVIFTLVGTALRGSTGAGAPGASPAVFRTGDQAAMIGLGVLAALGVLLFTRPRVEADAERIRVRNVIGGYDLPWSVVREVRFDRSSSWAVLELHDDDVVPVLALQAADKQYAVDGVRALRELHARSVPG